MALVIGATVGGSAWERSGRSGGGGVGAVEKQRWQAPAQRHWDLGPPEERTASDGSPML